MELHLEWARPMQLRDATHQNLIYSVDIERLPKHSGIYILGRRWSSKFEAIYVGKASNIRGRVKSQLNNVRLMTHLKNAKTGKRILLTGKIITRPGQRMNKCLTLVERALIRHFLSEGHNLVNIQGTRLGHHEIVSSGRHPKRWMPTTMYLEKSKGQ